MIGVGEIRLPTRQAEATPIWSRLAPENNLRRGAGSDAASPAIDKPSTSVSTLPSNSRSAREDAFPAQSRGQDGISRHLTSPAPGCERRRPGFGHRSAVQTSGLTEGQFLRAAWRGHWLGRRLQRGQLERLQASDRRRAGGGRADHARGQSGDRQGVHRRAPRLAGPARPGRCGRSEGLSGMGGDARGRPSRPDGQHRRCRGRPFR